jgi:Type ISP C-terminal specificity domain
MMTMRRPTLSSISEPDAFQAAYPARGEGNTITKEDLFYYIYGLLHSPDYRSRYADNLGKELPRIPVVRRSASSMWPVMFPACSSHPPPHEDQTWG